MRVVEFGGGLGDTITMIYSSERYVGLEALPPDEKALIVLMSHNPFTRELFLWHPNASRFEIKDLGFWWPWEDEKNRALHKLPPAQKFEYSPQKSVKFYPSPSDFKLLEQLHFPYIVMASAAGGIERNIPGEIVEDMSSIICTEGQKDYGFREVVVGRSYGYGKREEHTFIPRGGIVNFMDELSVPGMIELIARSKGVICCHSAVCLIAWYLKKPVYLLYPKEVQEREFDNRAPHQYTIGKDFPTTMHTQFANYKKEDVKVFLEMASKS